MRVGQTLACLLATLSPDSSLSCVLYSNNNLNLHFDEYPLEMVLRPQQGFLHQNTINYFNILNSKEILIESNQSPIIIWLQS